MVFAMTSSLGVYLPSEDRHLHEYLVYSMDQCPFKLFKKSEAELYIKSFKKNCTMSINTVRSLTNFNPYFLSRINEYQNEYENKGRIKAKVTSYFNELVQNISHDDLCSWMLSEVEMAQKWFYKASNKIPLGQEEVKQFSLSWVYTQHICECTRRKQEYLLIYAIPLSEALLIRELAQKRKQLPYLVILL